MNALVRTRLALHRVAEDVVSPLRVQATGNEIALTPRPGGFGTPDLPGGGWVGVSGTGLVVADAAGTRRTAALTTLRDAARHAGLEGASALPGEPLEVDPEAAALIARVFADGQAALEAFAAEAGAADEPSPVHLWPEHFDIAIELGPEALGCRATYGVSPGDERHDAPYAYVAPWVAPPAGELWQATGFTGAELPHERFDEVLGFWRARRDALAAACPR